MKRNILDRIDERINSNSKNRDVNTDIEKLINEFVNGFKRIIVDFENDIKNTLSSSDVFDQDKSGAVKQMYIKLILGTLEKKLPINLTQSGEFSNRVRDAVEDAWDKTKK